MPDVHSVIFMTYTLLCKLSPVFQDEGFTDKRSEQDNSRKSLVSGVRVMFALRSVLEFVHCPKLEVEVGVKELA